MEQAFRIKVISTIIGFPLFICAIYLIPSVLFVALISLALLIATYEFSKLIRPINSFSSRLTLSFFAFLLTLSFSFQHLIAIAYVFLLIFFLIVCWQLTSAQNAVDSVEIIIWSIFSLIYLTCPMGSIIIMRISTGDSGLAIFCFMVTWIGDMGAAVIGRQFGQHQFPSKINPQKAWEGVIGRILISSLFTLMLPPEQFSQYQHTSLLMIGALLGLCGQVGDSFESMIKRSGGIAHSGKLIPGHGGMLDRLDSLTFVAPTIFLLSKTIV